MSVQQVKFTEIADAIRSKTGETELIKPSDFAGKVDDVYEAGKQAEYDRFWDGYLLSGMDGNFAYRFAGYGWTNNNFKPSRDIKPTGTATGLFYGNNRDRFTVDLRPKKFKEKYGVEFDISNATSLQQWVSTDSVEAVGTVNVTKLSNRLYYLFHTARYMHTIEKLILPSTAEPSMNTTAAFMNCNKLTTIEEIEGLFGSSISFSYSPLEHDTIMRIISALADYSDGSYKKTLTLGTANLAKLTDEEKVVATEKGWTLA